MIDVFAVVAVRPTKVEIAEGQLLCVVCSDIGNGVHFGAVTCEGCKVCYIYSLLNIRASGCRPCSHVTVFGASAHRDWPSVASHGARHLFTSSSFGGGEVVLRRTRPQMGP